MTSPQLAKPQLPFLTRLGGREVGLIAALFMVAALILGFGFLAEEVVEGDAFSFDQTVLMALRSGGNPADPIGPPWVEEMARDVTSLGSVVLLGLIFVAVVFYFLLMRKRHQAALMAVAVIGGEVITTLLKMGFDRPRPDLPHAARVFTASFPSGHATLSAVTYLTLGALLTRVQADRRVKAYFLGLAVSLTVVTGLSRIYLGVHYPSDVLAGWCVGGAWAILCWTVALRLQQRGDVEPPSPSSSTGEEGDPLSNRPNSRR